VNYSKHIIKISGVITQGVQIMILQMCLWQQA